MTNGALAAACLVAVVTLGAQAFHCPLPPAAVSGARCGVTPSWGQQHRAAATAQHPRQQHLSRTALRAAAAEGPGTEPEKPHKLTVTREDGNAPIDWLLSRRLPHRSRRYFRRMLSAGNVRIDGRVSKRLVRVRAGQVITVAPGDADGAVPPASQQLQPDEMPLRVLYEDEFFMAIDKPAGVVTAPVESAPRGTLLNGVWAHIIASGAAAADDNAAAQALLQGVVHRLDKDTSGVVLIAKTLRTSTALSAAFRDHRITKRYVAIAAGDATAAIAAAAAGRAPAGVRWSPPPDPSSPVGAVITIDAPLYRRPSGKMAVAPPPRAPPADNDHNRGHSHFETTDDGAALAAVAAAAEARPAFTRAKVLGARSGLIAMEVEIATGRQHQIRAHLAHAGLPVAGDGVYGPGGDGDGSGHHAAAAAAAAATAAAAAGTSRPLLHALSLSLVHPARGLPLDVAAPIPRDVRSVLTQVIGLSGAAAAAVGLPSDASDTAARSAVAAADAREAAAQQAEAAARARAHAAAVAHAEAAAAEEEGRRRVARGEDGSGGGGGKKQEALEVAMLAQKAFMLRSAEPRGDSSGSSGGGVSGGESKGGKARKQS